ncbi:unnamed protein product [Cylicocyclus nassatus]|uniref:RRM domain-containing protein n=1 Tax=Cylicocyclus nassatus TaxID=53992 RepID=A0AA36HG30_CYLNA|nr:unnamed protein product [Cylicocyclus nassatus]
MHPEEEIAMRGLQSFLLANKEAILSLLEDMDRPGTEREDSLSHREPPPRKVCSSSHTSQRSFVTKEAGHERRPHRDSAEVAETQHVSSHIRSTTVKRSRSRSDSQTPPHCVKHLRLRRHRERSRSRSRSRESTSRLAKYRDGREDPRPCRCIGIFGMNTDTSERDLENIFQEFGEIDYIKIVRDHVTGRSRGFGFVYYLRTRDAAAAREELKDARIDGMRVRVDFSVTSSAPRFQGVTRHQKRMALSRLT